jgi:hypothetical protein
VTPFEPPPWTIGRGDRFSVTASAVAGRSGRFGCPAKVSLGARRIAKSLQPNDATRWWRTWDPASRLFFALRDAAEAVDEGATIDEATAADPRLTAPQLRFVRHALHLLTGLPDAASHSAGRPLEVGPEIELSGNWGIVRATGVHLASADGSMREVCRLRYKAVRSVLAPGPTTSWRSPAG